MRASASALAVPVRCVACALRARGVACAVRRALCLLCLVLFRTGPGAPHHVVSRGSDPEGDLQCARASCGVCAVWACGCCSRLSLSPPPKAQTRQEMEVSRERRERECSTRPTRLPSDATATCESPHLTASARGAGPGAPRVCDGGNSRSRSHHTTHTLHSLRGPEVRHRARIASRRAARRPAPMPARREISAGARSHSHR